MFGEPLLDQLRTHGDKIQERMREIRDGILTVAQNTEAGLARNQWVRRPLPFGKKESVTLRNESAYGWLIRDVAVTQESEVFIDTESDMGFVVALKAGERDNVHWYIPPGSSLIVKILLKKLVQLTSAWRC